MENHSRLKYYRAGLLVVIVFLLSSMCISIGTNSVSGDGMVIPQYYQDVYLPSQKAMISWNGSHETLLLSTKFASDNITDMAWIVPVFSESVPEIMKGDIDVFYDLAWLFSQGIKSKSLGGGGFGVESDDMVQVIKTKKIDMYDITVLKAINASTLVSWLNEHNYATSGISTDVLQSYCNRDDCFFIANRVNLSNRYGNLTITQKDLECAHAITIPEWVDPDELDEYLQDEINDLNGTEKGSYIFDDCLGANYEVVKALVELKRGVATPLKITFQPDTPFYPMNISSMNSGYSEINVYIFSGSPMKDNNEILSIEHMLPPGDYDHNKFNVTADDYYITLLKYEGDLSNLNADSFFTPISYNPIFHPDYIPIETQIMELILPQHFFFLIFFFYPIPIIPLLFITLPFIVSYELGKKSLKIQQKKFPHTLQIVSLICIIILTLVGFFIGFLAMYESGWISFLPLMWVFCSVPFMSVLDGYYAAHHYAKKRVWLPFFIFLFIYSFILL